MADLSDFETSLANGKTILYIVIVSFCKTTYACCSLYYIRFFFQMNFLMTVGTFSMIYYYTWIAICFHLGNSIYSRRRRVPGDLAIPLL